MCQEVNKLGPRPQFEVIPYEGVTVNQFEERIALDIKSSAILCKIRTEKSKGIRLLPSSRIIIKSGCIPIEEIKWLVDYTASLVDENAFGRSDMCLQFAWLVSEYLNFKYHLDAKPIQGIVRYSSQGNVFEWSHAWVKFGDIIIDSNIDSAKENPKVPGWIDPRPYWGVSNEFPAKNGKMIKPINLIDFSNDQDSINWKERLLANNRCS